MTQTRDYRLMALGVALFLGGLGAAAIVGPMFTSRDLGLLVSMTLGALGGILAALCFVMGWSR